MENDVQIRKFLRFPESIFLVAGMLFFLALARQAMIEGCHRVQGRAACTRYADGSVECSIEAHRDGDHTRPVVKTP